MHSRHKFTTIFEKYPQGRFIDIHEFIGYLHADNHGTSASDDKSIMIELIYDDHYCQYFKTRESTWMFEVSDWFSKKTNNRFLLKVDDKDYVTLSAVEQPITI